MRILLDECVNPRLKEAFPGHDVRSTHEMGWNNSPDGKLLRLAQADFDVFLTIVNPSGGVDGMKWKF
jgi:predicted nuclease of predicted toxin-antitoxin system